MVEIRPCDRCGTQTATIRRYLWTIGIGVNPDETWELCVFCHEVMLNEMRYGAGAK